MSLPPSEKSQEDAGAWQGSPSPAAGPLRAGELACYATGSFGTNIIYGLVTTYLMFFYTEEVGLSAGLVAILMLVVRLWDAIFDLGVGIYIDRTHTRWGKFRPYLPVGGTLTGIATMLCFLQPFEGELQKVVYACATYIFWGMAFAVCDIPYWSMTPALTPDPTERTKVISISRTASQLGHWGVCVAALPVVAFFGGSWAWLALFSGIACIICLWICFVGVREKVVVTGTPKQSLKDVWSYFLKNRPLQILIGCLLASDIINGSIYTMSLYFFKYVLGREDAIPLYMTVTAVGVVAGCVLAPWVARRIGKVRLAAISILLLGACSVLQFPFSGDLTAILVLAGISRVFAGFGLIAAMSCMADCVEYGQWRTGVRAEGFVFATNVFKTKIAGAMAGAIPGLLLSLVGFQSNGGQSAATVEAIRVIFTLVLGGGALLAALPIFFYPLTETVYLRIVSEIRARAQSNE